MTNEERAFQMIQAELGDRPPTPDNIAEASIACTRRTIYEDYYYANPAVVEALLLNLRNFMELTFTEIDQMSANDMSNEEAELKFVKELHRFSVAMRKTIDRLYSV